MKEQDRIDEELEEAASYCCYNCGHNLEVGVDEQDSICWHCQYDEFEEIYCDEDGYSDWTW